MSTVTKLRAVPPQQPAPPPEAGLDLVALWCSIRKYWATALATALVISVAVAFYTLGQRKIYESSATVQFDPNSPRPLGGRVEQVVELGTGPVWDTREYYETQYQIIQSMKVAGAVVGELGLNRDAAFIENVPQGVEPVDSHKGISEEAAAEVLRGRLRVDPVKGSRLARVRLQDANPERAARVLSTVIDTYVAQNLDSAHASTTSAGDWLRGQLNTLKNELESSEMALHDYKKDKNILSVAFADQSNMLREEMSQINAALTAVRTKREEIAARSGELAKVRAEDPSNLPASEFLQSSLLQDLRNKYIDTERERDSLVRAGKGSNHPDVQAAAAKVETSRTALLAEVRNIQGALNRDLSVAQRQEGGLSRLFERAKAQAMELNLLEIEYNRLRRSKENTEKLYSLVLERTKESGLTRMLNVNNIRVLDRPRVSSAAVRPNIPVNVGAGIVVGIVLGIGAAMARTLLDRTLKTPDDVERVLGATCLGLIPEIEPAPRLGRRRGQPMHLGAVGAPELIVHENPTSGVAEASRSVRTNLLFMAPDKPYRTLLVTSAGPAEGKTTVACCIAVAMAQAGKRVGLIDCDLRRPRLHRIFKRGSDVGLTTALLDDEIEDAFSATTVPNLSIHPAGPVPPNPAELLQSERFRAYLKRISGEFDQIILDSPPLVAVTDAAVLSTLVDGTVLVVRAFRTRKDFAQHAVRALTDVGATVAGVVLNAVNLTRDEYRYGYRYYRRDQYYGRTSTEDGSAATPPAA